MQYALQLLPHANTRYLDSLAALAQAELSCLLSALGTDARCAVHSLGGTPFLCFSCEPLPADDFARLSQHSATYLAAELTEDGLLRPLARERAAFVPRDIAEVLKYKGKTNAVFSEMLLNLSLCASDFLRASEPLTVLDPLCGRGTGLFVALRRGMHALGVEQNARDTKECADFLVRFLQHHRLKYEKAADSLTLPGGKSARRLTFTLARDAAALKTDARRLTIVTADSTTERLLPRGCAHLLIADLPYGVQHAPQTGASYAGHASLLHRALPVWRAALREGGALALSFNTYTLPHKAVVAALTDAGFVPLYQEYNFEHWVEQAVNRDVVVARREPPRA